MSRLYPFGNGSLQERLGPATRKRRIPWKRQQPPFPESLIHCEAAFQTQTPRLSQQTVPAPFINWPWWGGELIVPGLRNQCTSAVLLCDPRRRSLHTESGETGLLLMLPKTPPDAISSTIAVRILGTPDIQAIS